MSLVQSHSLSVGIVGLPNAGKSTLFNSLTKNTVESANYPFTTIDKNVGVIEVPDERLDKLEDFFDADKKVPAAMKFVDIAGLVKGASKGEGLGNKFLSHIREVNVIMYVLRAFKSDTISHVYERVDPLGDLEIVESELILRDVETVSKKLVETKRNARGGADKETQMQLDLLERLLPHLDQGKSAITLELKDEDEEKFLHDMWLLSAKDRMYVLNTQDGFEDEEIRELIDKFKASDNVDEKFVSEIDVKILGEISDMNDEERKEYEEMLGFEPKTTRDVVELAMKKLQLISYFTGSEKEVNAWSIREGTNAKAAAGAIHSDLSDGFITADVVNVEKLIEAGSLVKAKEQGLIRNQGKDYIVEDGDYILIHSSK